MLAALTAGDLRSSGTVLQTATEVHLLKIESKVAMSSGLVQGRLHPGWKEILAEDPAEPAAVNWP